LTSEDLTSLAVSELFSLALTISNDDTGNSPGWRAVSELHKRGTDEIFVLAQSLCQANDPHERTVGADILGQLGWPAGYPFCDETLPILFHLIETDQNTSVLNSACIALGHLHDERAIEPLLTLKDHPNDIVRYGVIVGLFGFEDDHAINALIELSRDIDIVNRDWATSALGTLIDSDTEAIRDALYARLDDIDEQTRGEAMSALAKRKDQRVFPFVLNQLEKMIYWPFLFEAAQDLADPRLLPALYHFRDHWEGEKNLRYNALEAAIAACEGKQNPD
jgi:HEAT repeat protein